MRSFHFLFIVLLSASGELARASDFELQDLLELVQRHPTVDAALEALPNTIRLTQTYGRSSSAEPQLRRSVSERYPRIVMSNQSGTLALSVITDPSSPLYNVVQVIHKESPAAWGQPVRIERTGNKLLVHKPAECLTCHVGGRPIWDGYPRWRDFWGSVHAQDGAHLSAEGTIPETGPPKYISEPEFDSWQRFVRGPIHEGRIGRLLPINQKTGKRWVPTLGDLLSRNTEFGQKIGHQTQSVMLSAFKSHPDWNQFRLSLYRVNREANEFLEAFSEATGRDMAELKSELDSRVAKHSAMHSEYAKRRRETVARQLGEQIATEFDHEPLLFAHGNARLEMIANELGLDMAAWSSAHERRFFSLSDGTGPTILGGRLQRVLEQELLSTHPELKKQYDAAQTMQRGRAREYFAARDSWYKTVDDHLRPPAIPSTPVVHPPDPPQTELRRGRCPAATSILRSLLGIWRR